MKLPIQQKLPILMGVLLFTVITVFGVVAYIAVKQESLKYGTERLKTVSDQLSFILQTSAKNIRVANDSAAKENSVYDFLVPGDKKSLAEAMNRINEMNDNPSSTLILLTDGRGNVLIGPADSGSVQRGVLSATKQLKFSVIDSTFIGALYSIDTVVSYPVITPIKKDGMKAGYFVRWRMMNQNSQSVKQLTRIIGNDARLLLGNNNANTWLDISSGTNTSLPRVLIPGKTSKYQTSDNHRVLAISTLITGTPWALVVEYPENTMLAPARKVLLWIVIAGIIILVTGVLVGGKMSRGISIPLKQLTEASSRLASGNYSGSIVHINRLDELGKLARAFNTMSTKVESSQNTLEEEARKYKILFERNPMPMLIISRKSNLILDVNESAIRHYGYCKKEFLAMKAVDLRPEIEKTRYLKHIVGNSGATKTGVWKHMKKDGTIIMVDIIGDDIEYKGEPCRIILTNDITEKLKAEQQLIDYQVNQHKRMTEVAMEAQEKEREEIGKELHDNVNQILASIKLHLELAKNSPEEFPEAIANSYEYVNLAIKEIRHLSKSLVRPALEDSLVRVIYDLLKETETLTGLKIDFNYEHFNENLLTESSELMLYRILQEQLNNIIKHARASEVKIELFNTDESCIMHITDNGIGFDTSEKAKGIGLRNIENRVSFYKGICKITSQPGMGTGLRLSFPVPVRA